MNNKLNFFSKYENAIFLMKTICENDEKMKKDMYGGRTTVVRLYNKDERKNIIRYLANFLENEKILDELTNDDTKTNILLLCLNISLFKKRSAMAAYGRGSMSTKNQNVAGRLLESKLFQNLVSYLESKPFTYVSKDTSFNAYQNLIP